MLRMATKRRRNSETEDRHKHKPLGLRLNVRVMNAMRQLAEKNRRTLTAEMEIALEKYLAEAGLWPPSRQDQP